MNINRRRDLHDDATLEDLEQAAVWQLDQFVEQQTRRLNAMHVTRQMHRLEQWVKVIVVVTLASGSSAFAWTAPHAELALAILALGIVTVIVLAYRMNSLDHALTSADMAAGSIFLAILMGVIGGALTLGIGTLLRWMAVSMLGTPS